MPSPVVIVIIAATVFLLHRHHEKSEVIFELFALSYWQKIASDLSVIAKTILHFVFTVLMTIFLQQKNSPL